MTHNESRTHTGRISLTHFVSRVAVGTVVLAVTAFITPAFSISGLWPLLFAAVVLAALDYALLKVTGFDAAPFGRGVTGFILAAAIIYFTGFFVKGYSVTLPGAMIGALVYGLADMLIPGRAM